VSDLVERLRSAIGDEGLEVPETGVPIASPATEAEAQAVLRLATEAKAPVLPMGNGTKLGWCPPAERVELCVSTRRMAGVVSYEPEDGTVTARAGTSMNELAEIVRAGGHHLSPEVRSPDDSGTVLPHPTLGGVIAAGESGADRLRYGPVRNVLLGTRAVYSDGSAARSGGQLVKNVTGYELHKLHCGSHGTLGLITEASLRLFPLPRAGCGIVADLDSRERALQAARVVGDLPVRPVSVVVLRSTRESVAWKLRVYLAGLEEAVVWERDRVLEALQDVGARETTAAPSVNHEDAADDEYGGWPGCIHLSCRPTRIGPTIERLDAALRELCPNSRAQVHPLVARIAVRLIRSHQELDLDTALALRARLSEAPAVVQWRNPPAGFWEAVGPPEVDASGLELMRGLRAALDPAETFARGRLLGGTA
jgi:glycolate oxidase FAD binding subunit